MAKRNYKKKSMKVQPSVMTMSFIVEAKGAGKEVRYIDLSQCASLLNRRFYRQGINWAVSGFKILSESGVTGQISIHKLPNTWVMSNAWEKGFRSWTKMINETTEDAPSIRPRFLDFKIYADNDHHQLGSDNNLLPHSSATLTGPIQTATPGEWDYSTYEIPLSNVDASALDGNSVTRDVIAVGSSYVNVGGVDGNYAVSLIEGYASSRALPDVLAPNMPGDALSAAGSNAQNWMTALFNEGNAQDSEVLQDLETQNSVAPYPFEDDGVNFDTMYPGGANQLNSLEIHDQEFVTGTTVGGTTRLKGGNFPCGLIGISTFGFARDDNLVFQVSLVPGTHRGYLCEPMTEM